MPNWQYKGYGIALVLCDLGSIHIFIDGNDVPYRVPDSTRDHWKFAKAIAEGIVDRTVVIENAEPVMAGAPLVRESILC